MLLQEWPLFSLYFFPVSVPQHRLRHTLSGLPGLDGQKVRSGPCVQPETGFIEQVKQQMKKRAGGDFTA